MLMSIWRRVGFLMVALLLALAAVLTSSGKPAEAIPFYPYSGSPGGSTDLGCGPTDKDVPLNDNFAYAKNLPWFEDLSNCNNNNLATLELGDPKPSNCSTTTGTRTPTINRSTWYKITPKYTSTVTLSAGRYFGSTLALYKLDAYQKLQQVSCTTAYKNWQMPSMTKQLQGGQTYYLQFTSEADLGGDYKIYLDWDSCYYSSGVRLCPVS